ncbi:hypothetical protein Tco_0540785 [Tanacetum coccineum]
MTPSVPRSPNPKMDTTESSAPKQSTVIHFRLPERRSARLTPPAPVPTIDKEDEMILQDTLQVLLSTKFEKSKKLEKMNDEPKILGTRLEPRSDKESLDWDNTKDKEEEITNDEVVEVTNLGIYKLKNPYKIIKLLISIPSQVDRVRKSYMIWNIFFMFNPIQSQHSLFQNTYQLNLSMKVDPQLQQQDIAIWLALQMKFESLQVPQTTCRTSAVRPRDQDDPHDDAHPEGENRAKSQKTSEYEAYVSDLIIVWIDNGQ